MTRQRETTPGAGSSRGPPPRDTTRERSRLPCRTTASRAEALVAPPRDALKALAISQTNLGRSRSMPAPPVKRVGRPLISSRTRERQKRREAQLFVAIDLRPVLASRERARAEMSGQPPYGAQPSAPPMQPTYPSVQQPPPVYPPAPQPPPPQPVHAPAARAPSTTEDLKAVAKGVAGVARLVGKGAAALGTAAVKAGASSASVSSAGASSASAHPPPASRGQPPSAPYRSAPGAAPFSRTVAPPAPAMFRAAPAFANAAPVPHAPPRGDARNAHSTCWCGFRDDPETAPCARVAAKAALFPLAAAAYPLGAALWAALQAHVCVFSCCMLHHVHNARGGARHGVDAMRAKRDVVDCWQCQAEAWMWLDDANGNCWVCELPVSKRVLRGHIVEAPCQLCLWGSER